MASPFLEQSLLRKGLVRNSKAPSFIARTDSECWVSGYEDNGNVYPGLTQAALQIEAAQIRHPHVEHYAGGG